MLGPRRSRDTGLFFERLFKTDPYASWASFVDEFISAKKATEDGKGEPELYVGPSPSFILAPQTQEDLNQVYLAIVIPFLGLWPCNLFRSNIFVT